jgi:coatomer subunit beta'
MNFCVWIDDMTIKLWDWDAKWALKQTFEGHIHYVMQIAINPKDNNTFASASLDRTVKVKDNEMRFLF